MSVTNTRIPNIGKFVNADIIEKTLRAEGELNFKTYNIKVTPAEFKKLLKTSSFNEKQDLSIYLKHLSLKSNLLKIKSADIPYSYIHILALFLVSLSETNCWREKKHFPLRQ